MSDTNPNFHDLSLLVQFSYKTLFNTYIGDILTFSGDVLSFIGVVLIFSGDVLSFIGVVLTKST